MVIGVAVIGCGRWGTNHVRNLVEMSRCRLRWVCDVSQPALERVAATAEEARLTTGIDDLLDDGAVDAVVIATPATSHAQIASACLRAGKHLLVEKPLCRDARAAAALVTEAAQQGLVLQVGHLCVHQSGMRRILQLIGEGELGPLRSVETERSSQPSPAPDVDVLWDLAVHDIAIANAWVGARPLRVAVRAVSSAAGLVDEATVELEYPGGIGACVQVSWRKAAKVRRATAVGDRARAIFDDLAPGAPVVIDLGGGPQAPTDMTVEQPLRVELDHFLDSIERPIPSLTSGQAGLDVVLVLAAVERSLASGGDPVAVDPD